MTIALKSPSHTVMAMQDNQRLLSVHPRRAPAHLSVSLKHDRSPPSVGHSIKGSYTSYPKPKSNSSANDSANAQQWFTGANETPMAGVNHNDPPFYQKQSNSSTSHSPPDGPAPRTYAYKPPQQPQSSSGGADDFRSVIDDLTIQNKKLKERLRKYEASYNSHLDKEKLFEVKVHSLSPSKRRELEDTLRSFATSVTASRSGSQAAHSSTRHVKTRQHSHETTHKASPLSRPSSSTSNSHPHDSAYASMSSNGPSNSSKPKRVNLGKGYQEPAQTHDQRIESFLDDIPAGLFPKQYSTLTDKAKKKIVVRRLEQLFTGRRSPVAGPQSQPLQQQEISKSAAKADREAVGKSGQSTALEGHREAPILGASYDAKGATLDHMSTSGSNGSDGENRAPEQRPTRPLDLDPERAQDAADNLEYIRHLGLHSPKRTGPSDEVMDSDGWIYLNLLVSMAQLHIINVTPDFIRTAVTEYSEQFEISRDGRKLRWKGGNQATRLSSDSGESGSQTSPRDSDGAEDDGVQISNENSSSWNNRGTKKSYSRSHLQPKVSSGTASKSAPYHYKPLFRHCQSSSEAEASLSESDQHMTSHLNSSGNAQISSNARASSGKKTGDEGMLVFYSGASFVVDLSSDRRDIATPRHYARVGNDGYHDYTTEILGCKTSANIASQLYRSDSGSQLNSRPFKDYSAVGDMIFQDATKRPRTPDPVTSSDEDEDDLEFRTEWSTFPQKASTLPQDFDYSGLGGTRPSDNFCITVDTTRTKIDAKARSRLSRFSAPTAKRRKFMHNVSDSSLAVFRGPTRSVESISSRIASLRADSPTSCDEEMDRMDLPIKITANATSTKHLAPSRIPPPAMWYNPMTSEDSYSDVDSEDSSGEDIAMLRKRMRKPVGVNRGSSDDSDHPKQSQSGLKANFMKRDVDMADVSSYADDIDDSDDESIDMLAAARAINPEAVAQEEAEFEREALRKLNAELPIGSSAATVDGKYGSAGPSSDEDEEVSDSDVSMDGEGNMSE